jgi:TrmH family RNA methyltransferase
VTASLDVVLIRPKEDGNVGAVARVARNFGAARLTVVAPRARLGSVARRRAMGGLAILKSARISPSFLDATATADLVVGTTDLVTGQSTAYLRRSVSPERLGEIVRTAQGTIAIVFGPEDNGLSRAELARCDLLVHVPARREFPTLNLSHAVALVLFSVHRAQGTDNPESTPAPDVVELDGTTKELFLERLGAILARTGYPPHKRRGMVLMWRRILGRSTPGKPEYRMMLGLLKSLERSMPRAHGD